MDLRRLAIVSLILAGCGISPDVHYQKGRLLLKQGKQKEAMVEAEAGWRAEPSWRFRILKADILLVLGEAKAAAGLLAFPEPPTDPESRVRLCMDKAWTEYSASDSSGAEKLLAEAAQIARALGRPVFDAMIENRRGLVELQEGRTDTAEQSLRHSIQVADGEDPYLHASNINSLGYF